MICEANNYSIQFRLMCIYIAPLEYNEKHTLNAIKIWTAEIFSKISTHFYTYFTYISSINKSMSMF